MKVINTQSILGEGLEFLPSRNRVIAFDILGSKAFLLNPYQDWAVTEINLPFRGSCATELPDGSVLIAADHSLYRTEDFAQFNQVIAHELPADVRMNDGRVDPLGRFWYSTMTMNGDRQEGAIFCYDHLTGLTRTVFSSLTIPNTIAFDAVRRRGYYSDSAKKVIWAFDYEQDQPSRSVFLDFSNQDFAPDGAVVDAVGRLWNAQWGAGRVAVFSPDGHVVSYVKLPVSQPTCPLLFGDTLLVTSARLGLSPETLQSEPEAGNILVVTINTIE